MKILLKAKHWQIFGLFTLLFMLKANYYNENDNDTLVYIFLNTISILLYITINTLNVESLMKFIQNKKDFSWKLLDIFFYIHIFVIMGFVCMLTIFKDFANSRSSEWIVWFFFIPYQVLVLVNYYYAGKVYADYQLKVHNNKKSTILYVLCLIFYPIGVWFLQPINNKHYEILENQENQTN